MRGRVIIGMVCLGGLLAGAPAAQAAVTIGSNLGGAVGGGVCDVDPCTNVLDKFGGQQITSPIDGVVVRWRLKTGAAVAPAALRVLRFDGANGTGAGTGEFENLLPSTINEFPARLAITAGDFIGFDSTQQYVLFGSGEGWTWFDSLPDGGAPVPAQLHLLNSPAVNVDIEPDADRDGWGDETQDQCPTEASTHGACPDRAMPDTTITRKPSKKHRRRSIVRFESSEPGSTFTCVLDGSDGHGCSSPMNYKNLARGRHELLVAATDPAGNTDTTPAETRFFLKRQR